MKLRFEPRLSRGVKRYIRRRKADLRRRFVTATERTKAVEDFMQQFVRKEP
jgi:hypothetical protein